MNILKPIEFILLAVFNTSYKITDNYGISLLIMSIVITLGTYPLYYLADIWKEKELSVQREMKDDIDKISNSFTGQKKFYLIQTTYRLHNYKSWYAFRTSLGILIQIPFFFAAYNVLSSYTGYIGYSFLFINDLSKPDGLFCSINLLPFLMTLFNFISSVIFTKSIKFSDNKQQYILAIVFLLLLYDSPSALLIYWTFNNFLSIFKSLIRVFKNKEKIILKFDLKKDFLDSTKAKLMLITSLFFITIFFIDKFSFTTKYFELLICLINLIIFCLTYVIKKNKIHITNLILYLIYCICIVAYLLKKIQVFGVSGTVLLALIGYICIYLNFYFNPKIYLSNKNEYFFNSLILIVFLLLIPLNIYSSNVEEFSISINKLIISILTVNIFGIILLLLLKKLFFKNNSILFSVLLFSLISFVFYNFIFKLDYGLMSEFSFQKDYSILENELWFYIKDFIIVCLLVLLTEYLILKKQKLAQLIICGIILFYCVNIAINFSKNYSKILIKKEKQTETNYTRNTFSLNKKNVLFIMSDMMNGNYLERYLNEYPEVKNNLKGFTWYKDTVSIASATINSLPSMFSGDNYTPDKINESKVAYIDYVMPGVINFWEDILDENYSVSYVTDWNGLNVDVNTLETDGYNIEDYNIVSFDNYVDLFCSKNNITINKNDGKTFLLQVLPLFLGVPNTIKKYIYNNGIWNNSNLLINSRRNFSITGLSFFDVFEDISDCKQTEKNKFIYILSSLTHDSYGINKDGELISKVSELGDSDLPYYSAKKFLDELMKIIEWLKNNNLYDNTMIVICSDHGNSFCDNQLCNFNDISLNQKNDLSKAYPVFFVKNYTNNNDFFISNSYMQNSDVYYYIQEYLLNNNNSFTNLENDVNRKRYFYACNENMADFKSKIGMKFEKYTVNGYMFDKANWSNLNNYNNLLK